MSLYVYFETYGCSANQNNTEIMAGLVKQSGLEITNNEKIADIIVINSCIVKGPTENKIKRRISDLQALKKPIIIAGCMPSVRVNQLSGLNIYLLDICHTLDIVKLIKDIQQEQYSLENYVNKKPEVKLNKPKIPLKKKIGITQISEGCLGNCSFCMTKYAKGQLYSYPEEDIIKNVSQDIKSGCKEIWLTSQDSAAYGLDKGKSRLPQLLTKILNIKGNFRLRLGMMNPNNVLPILKELIELYKNDKMYKFLHIPLQSGSDKILKSMNRKYSSLDFINITKEFKKEIPNITLATDIIVAFPGETNEDFNSTKEVIKKVQPQIFNISRFWPMQGTLAYNYKQISPEIAKKRDLELHSLQKSIAKSNNQEMLNKDIKVFISEYDKKTKEYLARTESYQLVKIKSETDILGKTLICKIIKANSYSLSGEIKS